MAALYIIEDADVLSLFEGSTSTSVLFRDMCCSISPDALTSACAAQVERNLHDAMGVARNVMMDPRLVPGGGAVEMAISRGLYERSASLQGTQQVIVSCLSSSHNLQSHHGL